MNLIEHSHSCDIGIGIDVDGTLTNERLGEDIMTLIPEQVKKRFARCTLKKGADILFDTGFNIWIITGRREKYREVTTDWLDTHGILYKELVMIPDDFYSGGYCISRYVSFKVDSHLKRNIRYALDDNIHVIEALNENGISACCVDDDFRKAFENVFRQK